MMTRREFTIGGAAALLATPLPAQSVQRVLDLHTHVFSVLYLPVEGILARMAEEHNKTSSLTVPPVLGRALGRVLNTIALHMADRFTAELVESTIAFLRTATEEAVIADLFRLTPAGTFADPLLREAIAIVAEDATELYDQPIVSKDRFSNAFQRLFTRFAPAIPPYFGKLAGFVKWAWLLVHNEHVVAATLRKVSPEVSVFVHHLMDMESYYDGKPMYPVVTMQIPLMAGLAKDNPMVFGFVAFDPRKYEASLDVVKYALVHGFLGVKFYPPNGYQPLGNAAIIKDGDKIDKANRALFAYCAKEGVPIFTHCTPEGFASHKGFGCYADPRHWVQVLKDYPDLRLCFGHAGGEEWWLQKPGVTCGEPHVPFGRTVASLCQENLNVYGEFAYFNDLRDPKMRATFSNQLITATASFKRLPERLCYGTDWMMPQMFIDGTSSYLAALRDVFTAKELRAWSDRFFYANAIEYLNIRAYIARHQKYNPTFLSPEQNKALLTLQ